ncbi:suppressor of fused domain protein [Fuerstiella marisgermanici]|uniref:Suppressor of fused protein (SUFU) n=1 Tax=Fuerstiella marisgermanici TaxID=1891926 RepID=A0A1P8WJJ6_9PLAN|nr:suppressor of fused domain protein [Fuerstiella marisgermanici]APZ94234.1 Suppressor of fused protein (SUFU) [Fuerstiella marisgermanici]
MTIVFKCHACDKRYKVSDERANKRVKCKQCGTVIEVPPLDEPEEATDGTAIYRHEARERDFEPAIGNEKNIEAISNHIEAHVGPVEMVFHELISDMVHVDVHWVAPTKERNWHTLITSGMSDRAMIVPDELVHYEYAELMISLPPDWPLSQEAFEDENNYWPVRLLKGLARLPHEFDTWLGIGHTIPNGDPAEPYAENAAFSCALLMPPIETSEEFHELELDDGSVIHFYAIVPMYEAETNYKLNKGLEALIGRFEKHGVGEVVDTSRRDTCRKRFGLF